MVERRGDKNIPGVDLSVGRAVRDISVGMGLNILNAIDSGVPTQEIRESLERVLAGVPIRRQDTQYFVLGLSQSAETQSTEESAS